MESVVETAIKNPSDQENFAKWIGMEDALVEDQPADEPADPSDATEPAEAPETEAVEETDGDQPDAEAPEPIKLPFEARAGDDIVDAGLLASMELTLKADGKEVTLPLADVVRRAQSEPAAQRQARAATERASQLEQMVQAKENEVASVRALALQMLTDPDVFAKLQLEYEEYNAPEARAQRAEQALAAERQRKEQEQQSSQRNNQIQQFAAEMIVPTLDNVMQTATLVKEEELLGKFYADTARWTVNGVIDPSHHQDLAHYLRTEFAAYAATRQAEETAREDRIRAQERKTQLERQKLKNQTASGVKPTVTSGLPVADNAKVAKPRTAKEAEQGALNALLGGLS